MQRRYSWKTTLAGCVGLLFLAIAFVMRLKSGEPLTEATITFYVSNAIICVGLITARDNDKTSREVGAVDFAVARNAGEAKNISVKLDHAEEIRQISVAAQNRRSPPKPPATDNLAS